MMSLTDPDLFFAAIDTGDPRLVRALIDAGANAGQKRPNGATALMYASMHGHHECVRALLEAGADFTQAAHGLTALAGACAEGRFECVRALLEAGADVAQAAEDGRTALMRASQQGQLVCMRVLLEAGADVAQAMNDGWTALMSACQGGHFECVRALLEAGADVAQAMHDGWTALIAASHCGEYECVRALLDAGADATHATQSGGTALIAASQSGRVECVRALLAAGADVSQTRSNGATALMTASGQGHHECVHALLEAGADVAQAANGLTALSSASMKGRLECVRALLKAGADVAHADERGMTALMFAVRYHECARALLEAGADVLQVHLILDYSAFELARESLETIQLLCAYAPSRDAVRARLKPARTASPEAALWIDTTSRWTSPLHHFEFLPIERVRALLAEGADLRAGDGKAHAPTPLSLAMKLLQGADDGRAALIVRAAAPWSPKTHALFPAGAKARAVEVLRIGWLQARQLKRVLADSTHVEVAFRDVWLVHIMPHAIERSSA